MAAKRQQQLSLPATLWPYVEDLRASGLFGSSQSAVIRYLIQRGIQSAIEGGLIPVRHYSAEEIKRGAGSDT